ncbi:MAG: hypothetical protein J6Y71_08690 [Ruminococcus sp.]|nr:hypothetical protein [Ruminococcus sp.]
MQVCAPELQELHRNKPDQADDIAAEAADAAAWDDAVSSCPVAAIVELVDDAVPETENNLAADNTDFAVVAADTAEDMAALVAVTDTAAGNTVPAAAADTAEDTAAPVAVTDTAAGNTVPAVAAVDTAEDTAAPVAVTDTAAGNTVPAAAAVDTVEDTVAPVAVTDTAAGNIVPAVAADIAVPEAADSVLCTADAPREVLQSFLYSDHLSHYGQVVRFCISRTCCRSFRILQ